MLVCLNVCENVCNVLGITNDQPSGALTCRDMGDLLAVALTNA